MAKNIDEIFVLYGRDNYSEMGGGEYTIEKAKKDLKKYLKNKLPAFKERREYPATLGGGYEQRGYNQAICKMIEIIKRLGEFCECGTEKELTYQIGTHSYCDEGIWKCDICGKPIGQPKRII